MVSIMNLLSLDEITLDHLAHVREHRFTDPEWDGFYSMVANTYPHFDAAPLVYERWATDEIPPDEILRAAQVKGVTGDITFGDGNDPAMPWAHRVRWARHPHLGWFGIIPDADPHIDPYFVYDPFLTNRNIELFAVFVMLMLADDDRQKAFYLTPEYAWIPPSVEVVGVIHDEFILEGMFDGQDGDPIDTLLDNLS